MQNLREKQLQYELNSDEAAAARKLAELKEAANSGSLETHRATVLISRMHEEVKRGIVLAQETRTNGIGGKYKGWLRKVPADVAALIAIRECISLCTAAGFYRPVMLQDLGIQIGKLYETEVRIRDAEKVNPGYVLRVLDRIKDHCTTNQRHLRNVFNTTYTAVMQDAAVPFLTKTELLQIGKFAVQACLDAGLIEQHRTTGSKGVLVHFTLNPEVLGFLTGHTARDVMHVIDKEAGAMLCPPDDWSNLFDGGYLSPRRKIAAPLMQLRNIRKSERARLAKAFTADNMPEVFRCGNYLQSIPYTVHKPTYEAVQRVWAAGGGALGVPSKNAPKRPEMPFPEDWDKSLASEEELWVFKEWKAQVVAYYDKLREWRGHVRELGGFLRATRDKHDRLWFPAYLDRRGRWYYRGTPNPQGSDVSKAVLHFHEKKALGKDGVFWLKVHIANSAGFDKERFEDRARWTEQHWASIEAALDEPENHLDVWGNDAPLCMFSAAWELREAYRSGDPATYCTGIPVHMDATCSGLQHFSALLRDEVGGLYVNLTDPAKCGPKQDIYARVAECAMQAIQNDLESTDAQIRTMAQFWSKLGIKRALAKKPVNS